MIKAVQTAIDFGADRINIPDTVGYSTPEEFGMIFKLLKDRVKGSDQIIWSAHTHNDLGMANANALSAIEHGADEVQGTINGIGERAGNSDLIETAAALKVRQDYFQAHSSINLKMSKKISNIVANAAQMPVPKNKAVTGTNAFSHESGIHQDGF
ncbi:hypothetical protein Q757_04190 [Oenococcus alcoholitolerans]|uniref:2-isopropylmalate synthase n=1 Tax=Oenococcus alcoholitolerans TaxID=931074 RepID=A0ABR4XR07_9LACO|nr:hypothetical protein Q757_04190 [Oenococcus alcoholitolerans]